jgi:uncharacterized protein (TIGR00369 family)
MLRGGCATLAVADIDKALDFYQNTLGLSCLLRFGEQWACLDGGDGLLIGLVPKALAPEGRQLLGLCTGRPFDAVVAHLEEAGVTFDKQQGGPEFPIRIAFFVDPDDNALYLTDTPPLPDVPQVAVGERAPLLQHLGLRWVARDGAACIELDVREDLRGPAAILQGGVIATLVDVAAAAAVSRVGSGLVATKEMTVKFLSPGRIGPIRAEAKAVRHANELIADVQIVDSGQDDRLIATGTATFAPVSGQ